ncbi:SDR family NAD(P)-dependent oxidoreductase [Agrococcus sp. ARC_14]|uniref:SDR family NAD(P)-dependent oxidoreductase n=1 Tax=Agrococcus sp. ARC_14 TaxID=2919927 RepID=UPI001F051DA5|nr:SDR family NAD(P)-dependent oxidoreductase [Agrococcus sp. ARC_14]MCH1882248.1 SDR family oxidoreductase [Agrococcus sp. ARC_14]
MRLKGKTAIITGAAQGIGRQIAARFAAEGSNVVVADQNGELAERSAREIKAAGGRAAAITVDVADAASVQALAAGTIEVFGGIDVLVNNAAIFSSLTMRPFEEISPEEWDTLFAVNAKGVFLACQAVSPAMRANGAGSIINISSSVVVTGRPNYAHYIASKGAVWALTHALATELGSDNVRVNCISPHGIVTEVPRATISEDGWRQNLAEQALKRKGAPDDLLGAFVFLASDESAYMTGQTLSLDAGLRFT